MAVVFEVENDAREKLALKLPLPHMLDNAEFREEAGVALRRFSAAGQVIVALVIASGAINTILTLGRWPIDWTSPYQAMLAAKIALVAAMVGLALTNRYALVPKIVGQPQRAGNRYRDPGDHGCQRPQRAWHPGGRSNCAARCVRRCRTATCE